MEEGISVSGNAAVLRLELRGGLSAAGTGAFSGATAGKALRGGGGPRAAVARSMIAGRTGAGGRWTSKRGRYGRRRQTLGMAKRLE